MLAHRVAVKLKDAGYVHDQAEADKPAEAPAFAPELNATTRAPVGQGEVSDEMKKFTIMSKEVSKQKQGRNQIGTCLHPPLAPTTRSPIPTHLLANYLSLCVVRLASLQS